MENLEKAEWVVLEIPQNVRDYQLNYAEQQAYFEKLVSNTCGIPAERLDPLAELYTESNLLKFMRWLAIVTKLPRIY